MSDTPTVRRYDNAHLAWLVCLYAILNQIRREGLMSIESDIEMPNSEYSLFHAFPQTLQAPYLDFATDILRMMVGGNLKAKDMQVYADHYIAGLMAKGGLLAAGPDESLLRTLWLCLWAAMKGYAPQVAVEFGRQAVPAKLKPSFVELEDLIKAYRSDDLLNKKPFAEGGMETAAERFVASLNS